MQADDQPVPEPKADAPEPVGPAAERLEPTAERLPVKLVCHQCRYDLAGLAIGSVCPECGLAIAASWPDWDLREAHAAYTMRLCRELGAIHSVVVCSGLVALSGAAVAWAEAPRRSTELQELGFALGAFALFVVGIATIATGAHLAKIIRRDPNAALTPGGEARKGMVVGATLQAAGVVSAILVAGPISVVQPDLGTLVGMVGVAVWLFGVLVVHVYAHQHALETLRRAGVQTRRTILERAPGLLPLTSLGLLPLAAFGVIHWAWIFAWALFSVALAEAGLALRCARARQVLKELLPEPK